MPSIEGGTVPLVTTKLWVQDAGYESAKKAFDWKARLDVTERAAQAAKLR